MGSRVRVPPRSPIQSNTYWYISEGLFPNFSIGKWVGSGNVSHQFTMRIRLLRHTGAPQLPDCGSFEGLRQLNTIKGHSENSCQNRLLNHKHPFHAFRSPCGLRASVMIATFARLVTTANLCLKYKQPDRYRGSLRFQLTQLSAVWRNRARIDSLYWCRSRFPRRSRNGYDPCRTQGISRAV